MPKPPSAPGSGFRAGFAAAGRRWALRWPVLAALVLAGQVLLSAPPFAGAARAMDSSAPRVVVLDTSTGTMLLARGENNPIAPANFAKIMTAAVVLKALGDGEIAADTTYKVSIHAWRTGGAPARVTTMFAAVRSQVSVDNLMRGLTVDYANDAAIVLAEGLSGSETAFADRMNAHAVEIGLAASHFTNPTGYSDPAAHTTLADMVKLAAHVQTAFPDGYALYGLADFDWNRIRQTNKTRLVRELAGADGLILAYDADDGFEGLVSARRGERRVIVAVSGLKSVEERDKEIRRLIEAAFADYARFELFAPGAEAGRVRVFGGAADDVPVTGAGGRAVVMTLPTGDRAALRASIDYDGPVAAPVSKGQRLARLVVRGDDGRQLAAAPLEAAADVEKGDIRTRALDGLYELLVGWWRWSIDAIARRI